MSASVDSFGEVPLPSVRKEDRTDPADREAWNAVVAKHERRVLVALVARGAPIDVAREVAQQAWLRIYEQHRAGRLAKLELPGIVVRQATAGYVRARA